MSPRVVKNAFDQRPHIVSPYPVHNRQALVVAHPGRAEQDDAIAQFRIADREFDRNFSAQAAGHEMVRRSLHEFGQIGMQLFDEVIDGDRLTRPNARVNRIPVVDEKIRHLHVEIAPPVAVIAVPRFRLFGEAVHEDERRFTAVFARAESA